MDTFKKNALFVTNGWRLARSGNRSTKLSAITDLDTKHSSENFRDGDLKRKARPEGALPKQFVFKILI